MEIGAELTLPRRQREGSITDEQITAIHEAIDRLNSPRGAVVVADGMGSEHSARNKARAAALLHEERFATVNKDGAVTANPRRYLTAHAVPDPGAEGKWIAAVSVRAKQEANKGSKDSASEGAPAAKPAPKK